MGYDDPASDPQNVPGSVPPAIPGSPFAADAKGSEPPTPVRTSGLAVASLVLGLFSCALSCLTGIPAAIVGIVALVKIGGSGGRLSGKGMAVTGLVLGIISVAVLPIVAILTALLLPAVQQTRAAAERMKSENNLRNCGMAMRSYDSSRGRFPAAGVNERGEGPNLSWRVQILRYIEEDALYEQFHLDEPWDSENNRALIDQMPEIYQSPSVDLEPGKTVYLAVAGPDTIFPGGTRGLSTAAIRDGTANTVMLVEADPDQAVIWTKPDDWQFDRNNPRRGLGSLRRGGFLALFADGHTLNISESVSDETLRRLFMVNDGQVIDQAELYP